MSRLISTGILSLICLTLCVDSVSGQAPSPLSSLDRALLKKILPIVQDIHTWKAWESELKNIIAEDGGNPNVKMYDPDGKYIGRAGDELKLARQQSKILARELGQVFRDFDPINGDEFYDQFEKLDDSKNNSPNGNRSNGSNITNQTQDIKPRKRQRKKKDTGIRDSDGSNITNQTPEVKQTKKKRITISSDGRNPIKFSFDQ